MVSMAGAEVAAAPGGRGVDRPRPVRPSRSLAVARRGAALITVLFLLLLLELAGLAYLRTVGSNLRAARERVQDAQALHLAEGALERLAARRAIEPGTHDVSIDSATIRVAATPDGPGWALEVVSIHVKDGGATWMLPSAAIEARLVPRDGGWRIVKQFR
jgi:hypothetical protein